MFIFNCISQDFDREFFKVHLDAKLTPGHKYKLRLAWTADIDDSLMGFYRSSYEMNGQTQYVFSYYNSKCRLNL